MRIEVTVGRVVLDGFALGAAERGRFEAALAAELGALLAAAPPRGAARMLASVLAPPLAAGADAAPEGLGRAVARSVHAALGGKSARSSTGNDA